MPSLARLPPALVVAILLSRDVAADRLRGIGRSLGNASVESHGQAAVTNGTSVKAHKAPDDAPHALPVAASVRAEIGAFDDVAPLVPGLTGGFAAGGNATGTQPGGVPGVGAVGRPPRVYFLFMAVDKVSNLAVWESFFAQAPAAQYRAFIHCKLPSCVNQVANSMIRAVPAVPSYYCTDLVSPMNQLLSQALYLDGGPSNPADKFAFVSDSTLPAKSFQWTYNTLSSRQGSDFCLFPANEWADIPNGNGYGLEVVPKHHQWLTLERAHAEKSSQLWSQGHMHGFMNHFGMNHNSYIWSNNTYGDNRNFGCLDEFWHFSALYGSVTNVDPHQDRLVDLYRFTGSPMHISAKAGWQGACDTFVVWSKYLHAGGNNPFEKLHWSLDAVSVPHGGNSARPGWWDTISAQGIHAIRNSEFLFVRKFIDNPQLANGGDFATTYSQIVFV